MEIEGNVSACFTDPLKPPPMDPLKGKTLIKALFYKTWIDMSPTHSNALICIICSVRMQ